MPTDPDQQTAHALLTALRAFAGGTFMSTSPAPGELRLTPVSQPRRNVHVSFLRGGAFIGFGPFTAESDVALADVNDGDSPQDPALHFDWALTQLTWLIEWGAFRRLPLLELVIPDTAEKARSLARSPLAIRYSRPWWDDHNRREAIPWSGPDAPATRVELAARLTHELRNQWNHWEGRSEAGVDPLSAAMTASALVPVSEEDVKVIIETFSAQLTTGDDGDLDVDAAVDWLIDRYRDRLPGQNETL
ncbi:hypothetical protein [Agrococcus sp. SGAir0287]|uniref:hypothetical protein n=1 Tax=Agrococcus sp. SGAir0287 TaxID=2070347 RepID=UPI0010CCFC40|nr:hypothetical protein [Agrococcus sp. SGAir0287]QCR19185.1 hypothetical protein C1N71_06840 [Agrococcus sp. SGAir0287]